MHEVVTLPRHVSGDVKTELQVMRSAHVRSERIEPFGRSNRHRIASYLHDGRLFTLEDTLEFFNLVLELKRTDGETKDIAPFLLVL